MSKSIIINTLLLILFVVSGFFAISLIAPQEAFACTITIPKFITDPASFATDTNKDRFHEITVTGGKAVTLEAVVKWENCETKVFRVALEDDGSTSLIAGNDLFEDSPFSILVEKSPTLAQFKWILGDDECGTLSSRCDVRISIEGPTGVLDKKSPTISTYFCNDNDGDGDGDCDDPFTALSAFYVEEETNNGTTVFNKLPINLPNDPNLNQSLAQIKSSPCYDPVTTKIMPNCIGLLSPLPGLNLVQVGDGNTGAGGLGEWVNLILRIIIGLASLLAVIMIILAGVQYMSSDMVTSKGSAKEKIQDALIGLLLALGIFIILNTINPDLLNTTPNIQNVSYSIEFPPSPYDFDPITGKVVTNRCGKKDPVKQAEYDALVADPSCPNCTTLVGVVSIISSGPEVDSGLANKLRALHQKQASGTPGWQITEAFPPSPHRPHCSTCHYNGTCVDLGLRPTPPSYSQLETFIENAISVGLKPVYEVSTEARFNELKGLRTRFGKGVLAEPLGSWISGEHFSIYN